MKKVLICILALLQVISVFFVFVGCEPLMSNQELIDVVQPLINHSLELNEILFGEGLQVETSESKIQKYLKATNLSLETASYLPVISSAKFQNEASLKSSIEAVYTSDYADYLYQLCFYGISPGDDDEVALGLVPVIYARYKTETSVFYTDDEILCVRTNLKEEAIDLAEVSYDYQSIQYKNDGKKDGQEWIQFSIDALIYKDGILQMSSNIVLKIVNQGTSDDAVWRLDSPTYFSNEILE